MVQITLTAKELTEIGSIDSKYAPEQTMWVIGDDGQGSSKIDICIKNDGTIYARSYRNLSLDSTNWISANFSYIK